MPRRISKKDPWKAKSWYNILAPTMFNRQVIGETPSDSPEKIGGRTVVTTLRDLTGDFKKSYIKLQFKVNEVAGENAMTDFVSHEVSRGYLRSQIKRRSTKINTIVDATTKDGKKLRVTVSTVCFRQASVAQIKTIRKIISEMIRTTASNMEFDQFVLEMILSKLASDAFKIVKKIYPVRRVEIVKSKVI